jgi:8-oxo-dGTP diphosphatase
MSVYVVRHAKAGSRHDWVGDDSERPLTKAGRKQSDEIARQLAAEPITGVWSSPATRCVQTVEPLARAHGLDVIREPRLAEGAPFEDVLALLGEVPDGAVLCSHGDVIPELLDGLVRRGTHLVGAPEWRKGSVWTLDPPDTRGAVATARADPPPQT